MLLSTDIVNKLGGPRKMAAALDRSESTIWRWLNESFSGSNVESVQALCRKKGIDDSLNTIIAIRNDPHEAPKKLKKQTPATVGRGASAQQTRKATKRRKTSKKRRKEGQS